MKSFASSVTESIENRSLPSIPPRTSTQQALHRQPISKNNNENEENLVHPAKPHLQTNKSFIPFSETASSPNVVYTAKNSMMISSESTVREDSSTSRNLLDDARTTTKAHSSYKNRFRNRWSKLIPYEKLDSSNEEMLGLKATESVNLPRLLPSETQFLQLVAAGGVPAVRAYLQDHPRLNVNCVNFQGVSALHIAVKNRSEAMVEFLLEQPDIEIGDTIMHAVRENNLKVLVKLLDTQREVCPGLEFAGSTRSPDFPEHVTPLILAAQGGAYEAVALLVRRGHTIPHPHSPKCTCDQCKQSLESEDPLRASRARLAAYRAVSAPAFLVHVSADPILAAFRLTVELRDNAAAYRQLAAEYLHLRKEVSAFAVDLLGCCRTSEEVEVVLKQGPCQSCRHFKLPRLLMAVDYRQKQFVAHPNTQLILESYWQGDWFSWKGKSSLKKGFIVLSRVFITPIILLMCVAAPRHPLVKHFQIPLNKLITHAAAYFVFLALVFHISNQDKTRQKRGPPNTGAEAPVVLYVFGYVWSSLRMCVTQGPRRYFSESWNLFNVTMLILFGMTFAFWIAAANDVAINDNEDLERKYWNQHDPTLLAEGTFCLATIFAFLRLMFLCQLNYHIGPLQVSLGKMTVDIFKYLSIFFIIMSAFAAGLTRLYQYYDGMVYEDGFGMKTVQVSSFTGLTDTMKTLFWALFCMAPLESADVVLDNGTAHGDSARPSHHVYTERIGYFCFGCFEVICVIVVLNMLIATMSNTFQRVINNAATEWTFGKTQVYLNYMSQTTLPPPYNLIPTASGMRTAVKWLRACARPHGPSAQCSCSQTCAGEATKEAPGDKDYPMLMSLLVQRYFRDKESAAGAGKVEDELEALRRELSSIRALLEKHPLAAAR